LVVAVWDKETKVCIKGALTPLLSFEMALVPLEMLSFSSKESFFCEYGP
jgi:hypothetical protein